MTIQKSRFILIVSWLLFMAVLLLALEFFARKNFGYDTTTLKLQKNIFMELDKLKVWNNKFIDEKREFFSDWPIPLETFPASISSPSYLFKANQKMATKDGKLVPAESGDSIFYYINSLGLKSAEILIDKTPGIIRIACLGASTTEGSSSNEVSYPTQLEKILKEKGFKVEVVNAGHGAYRLEDIVAFYKDYLLSLKPDILIFYEGSRNNFAYQEWLDSRYSGEYSWPTRYPKWFQFGYSHSALFVFASKQLGIEKKDTSYEHKFNNSLPKLSLTYYREKVEEIIRISKDNSIQPVLATFVNVAHDGLKVSPEEKPYIWDSLMLQLFPFSAGEINEIHKAYNNTLKEIAEGGKSIPMVDTASLFPKDPKYFNDYVHLTPEGDKLFAQHIADFLENEVLTNENSYTSN